ncbi:MAG: glycosyltransferase family 39 protein [Anaerolineae bacterium]|nr:glycosyltransferase family 39 protein [Anaerolineae bacterium]
MSTRLHSGLRVPTPQEITVWVRDLPGRLYKYFADPKQRVFWAVALLAILLRLAYLDLIPFGVEQVYLFASSKNFIAHPSLLTRGIPTQEGFVEPPLATYFFALLSFLGARNPLAIAALSTLINVLALIFCALTLQRYYGWRVGFLALLLGAANPWGVIFARQLSPLIPTFLATTWLFAALHRALIDHDPWGWTLAFLAWGLGLYSSFLVLPLGAILLLLFLTHRQGRSWLHLLFGAGLIILVFSPYFYEQNLLRGADLQVIGQNIRRNLNSNFFKLAWRAAWQAHSGSGLVALVAPAGLHTYLGRAFYNTLTSFTGGLFVLALLGMPLLALRAWSHWKWHQNATRFVLLSAWLWGALCLAPLQPHSPGPLFLALWFPAGFAAMAVLLDRLFALLIARQHPRRFWWAPYLTIFLWLILGSTILAQVYGAIFVPTFAAHHDTRRGYGVPYRYWRQITTLSLDAAREAKSGQLWVITQGTDPHRDSLPLILSSLLEPSLQTFFLQGPPQEALLLPAARPGVYLFTRSVPRVEENLRLLGGQTKGVVIFPDQREARIITTEGKAVEKLLASIQTRGLWSLDSGLCFIGYDQPEKDASGGKLILRTYWTFWEIPSEEREHRHSLRLNLATTRGIIASHTLPFGLPSEFWQEGLLLKQWGEITLPKNLQEGEFYIWLSIQREDRSLAEFFDAEGHPLGKALLLGPFAP